MSLIINTKAELSEALLNHPLSKSDKAALEDDELWEEVFIQLLKEAQRAEGRPKYGEDWEEWLNANIEELINEAVEIVM